MSTLGDVHRGVCHPVAVPKINYAAVIGVAVALAAACSSNTAGPPSQVFRTSAPTPSPGDDLIDVPVILGPTQQQLDALNANCGKVPGIVRTGIEPGMLFVEVYGFGPDNINPVKDCVTKLPFYRSTS